jgi:predicted enzyme related to lactoylglutathione lyase
MTDERRYPEGVPCWVDTEQPDVNAARQFYSTLFGWTFSDAVPADAAGTYLIAPPGFADAIGWLAPLANGHDHWHVTFTVASRDDSAETAEKLGAVVISSDDTAWTKTALIRDPQGAELTLSQFTPPNP